MEIDGSGEKCGRSLTASTDNLEEPPAKMPRGDVVVLAQQLHEASHFVQANACNKLKPIVDQMEFLRQQAVSILEVAQRDQELHKINCSFRKEWGDRAPHQRHIGSFRLEADQSWTPDYEIPRREQEMLTLRGLVAAGQVPTSTVGRGLYLQQNH
ncbi:hypothetical protein BIW11_08349 [Tropilaelaps mercedesae]|uniref:Uncharacterized protein n=1 Tax=Tropilaelaps mercedesae TaxID=418985 RepID=A0A1V9XPY5_9ACAR|nr:hypothetical protein BIW11_08349 [Tropilaelaps mercedesae]